MRRIYFSAFSSLQCKATRRWCEGVTLGKERKGAYERWAICAMMEAILRLLNDFCRCFVELMTINRNAYA